MILRFRMRWQTIMAVAVLVASAVCTSQASWRALGPDGGDVRSLTYDPRNPDRILLGTSSGTLFVSSNDGASWSRFAQLGAGDDLVLDHVVFDPSRPGTIYVAAWSVESGERGELFVSRDDGRTWETISAMHGKSIRAFALAPGHPEIMVVGALDGVFRSDDAGNTWRKITPERHSEMRNFESVAIDPADPNVIYAGTWHLPWKTSNGGASWTNIKQGIIDDSDVFSIIIDPQQPAQVYASACSGIYKSENAGAVFHKIQGIPFSARRTRVLKQDPTNSDVVYAGTTEGLWKTVDAGKTWKRVSAPNVIVNDVLVDPRHSTHVLLATDRSGVLASDDAGQNFMASNRGFAHRQVAALLLDRNDSQTLYAGLLNDKEYGGVFMSHDSGETWQQASSGLAGRDVFALRQAQDGTLVAGTNAGIFLWERASRDWKAANVASTERTIVLRARKGMKASTRKETRVFELKSRVAALDLAPTTWFAATSVGLFSSTDHGQTWHGGEIRGNENFVSVASRGNTVAAATARSVVVSLDHGAHWYTSKIPDYVTQIRGVAMDGDAHLWLASREGAFRSDDGGDHWEHIMTGLPAKDVYAMSYDPETSRLYATAAGRSFQSRDGGRSWHSFGEPGYSVRALSFGWGRVLAATDFDGVIVSPESTHPLRETAAGGSSE